MQYHCPDCRSTLKFHDAGCEYSDTPMNDIEKAYIDLLSILTRAPQTRPDLAKSIHGNWSDIHTEVFDRFKHEGRIESIGTVDQDDRDQDVWRLLTVDEYRDYSKEPTHPDLKTVYEHGPVDGCKDTATIAYIAYLEMIGFSWEETKETVVQWLHDTGAWERGSWDESTPEELLQAKKHVYDRSYGWKEAANAAASTIRSTTATRGEAR